MRPCAVEMGRLPEQGDRSCETRGPLIIQSGWVELGWGGRGGGYKQAFFLVQRAETAFRIQF